MISRKSILVFILLFSFLINQKTFAVIHLIPDALILFGLRYDRITLTRLALMCQFSDFNFKKINKEADFAPLHICVAYNRIKHAELILEKKQNIDYISNIFGSSLHLSIKEKQMEMIDLLLKRGAKTDIFNNEGRTALMEAIHYNHPESVELLLKNQADPNKMDEYHRNSLFIAVRPDWALEGLIRQHVSAETFRKWRIDIIKLLLKHNAYVNQEDITGKTPLWAAIEQNDPEIIKILISNGANPNIVSFKYGPLLHEVIRKGDLESFLLLKDIKGININIRDKNGETPLCIAIRSTEQYTFNDSSIIQALIRAGADPTVKCPSQSLEELLNASRGIPVDVKRDRELLIQNAKIDWYDTLLFEERKQILQNHPDASLRTALKKKKAKLRRLLENAEGRDHLVDQGTIKGQLEQIQNLLDQLKPPEAGDPKFDETLRNHRKFKEVLKILPNVLTKKASPSLH